MDEPGDGRPEQAPSFLFAWGALLILGGVGLVVAFAVTAACDAGLVTRFSGSWGEIARALTP